MTKGELRTWTKVVILYKQNYNVSSCQLETSNSLRRNLTSRSWPCDCLYMRPWDNWFILIEKQFVNRLELSVQVACNDNYNTLHVCITRYHIIFKSHKARKSQICVRDRDLWSWGRGFQISTPESQTRVLTQMLLTRFICFEKIFSFSPIDSSPLG